MADKRSKINKIYKQSKKFGKPSTSTFGLNGKGDFSKTVSAPPNNKIKSDFEELHQFDLTWQYGPCTGITRLERWERAARFGLSPPEHIKQMLLTHKDDKAYTECLWANHCL